MSFRVIAKLDVKPPFVVKPVHFEGLRKIGRPCELSKKYYLQGADEVMYIDIVASLYQRKILLEYVEETARNIFIPFAVGGGVRTIEDCSMLFHSGADKVVINTHAVQENPELISEASKVFGAQSVVVNIEAKRWAGDWECYTDGGRIRSGRSVIEWAKDAVELGAGEIIVQSVDNDGRKRGFDIDLIGKVRGLVSVPVIAASGAGSLQDIWDVVRNASPDAIALASILHYDDLSIGDVKQYLRDKGVGEL